jgi:hypothetical protein
MPVTRPPRTDPDVRHDRLRLFPWRPGVNAHTRKRLPEALGGQPAGNQPRASPPVPAGLLPAAAERPPPAPKHPPPAGAQGPPGAGHRVGVDVAVHDCPQPLARGREGRMAAVPPRLRPRVQRRHQARARRVAADDPVAGRPVRRTPRREAQNGDRVWRACAPRLPVRPGVWPTREQARFLGLAFPPARRPAVASRRHDSRGLRSGREAEPTVVGNADTHDVPWRDARAPGLPPPHDDVVPGDVRAER